MEKIQQILDNDEIEYDDELPKRQAAAMMVCIIKRSSCAVTIEGDIEGDEENDSASEADHLDLHGAKLGEP